MALFQKFSYASCWTEDRHGGGVMIYVSNSISYKRHLDLESVGIESVWIEIPLAQAKVFIGTYYRSCSETGVASIENFYQQLNVY